MRQIRVDEIAQDNRKLEQKVETEVSGALAYAPRKMMTLV